MPTLEEVKEVLERDTVAGFEAVALKGKPWLWLYYEPIDPRYYLEYPDGSVSQDYDELQEAYDAAKGFIEKHGGLVRWE